MTTAAAKHGFDRLELEGIPVYAGRDTERDLTGVLMFRVGRADETPFHGGVTHLVEHLALHGIGLAEFGYNGSVGGLVTSFGATGRPDEVASFLNRVARQLSNPSYERIPSEARVLRAEAMSRSLGPLDEALSFRFGNRGHGQRAMPELLIHAPDALVVRAWVEQHFTRGNAALWFTGPPPAGLAIELPLGPRMPAPPLDPLSDVRLPAWIGMHGTRTGISYLGQRRDWVSIPLEMASRRIMRDLRYDRGLIYGAVSAYEVLDAETAITGLWTDCRTEHAVLVRDTMLQAFEDLASRGATPDEIAELRAGSRRSLDRADGWTDFLASAASNELIGFRVATPEELVEEIGTLESATLAERMSAVLQTAIVTFPAGLPAPPGYEMYSANPRQVVGRSYRSSLAPWPWSESDRLVVGDDGVSWTHRQGLRITIDFGSCVAAVVNPGGKVDVFGADGSILSLDPRSWRRGQEAVDRVMKNVPRDRQILLSSEDLL